MTYNPSKGKVYALFKDQAKSDDILKAAFHVRYTAYFYGLWHLGVFIFSFILGIVDISLCFAGSGTSAFHAIIIQQSASVSEGKERRIFKLRAHS